jgi:hypothetical protein
MRLLIILLLIAGNVKAQYEITIPDSLIGRDFLAVTGISKSSSNLPRPIGNFGYAGEYISQTLIRFDTIANNRMLIRQINTEQEAENKNGLRRAISNSNLQPIAFVFEKCRHEKNHFIIDVTDWIGGENEMLFLNASAMADMRVGNFQQDKSYVLATGHRNDDIYFKTVKTYTGETTGYVSLELCTTLLLLSKTPMKPRFADEHVGYYGREVLDFDLDPLGMVKRNVITRWRLGPEKPIVFLIDPATPAKWIPYFKKGVEDWQPAFERAGFKTAIIARPAEINWSMDDPRESAIIYMTSDKEDASYSTIVDPRSGEIISCHIRWYQSVMRLLRNRYFIMASPSDARARHAVFDDSLMGQLIENTCAHEIGHALGFPHNFGASSGVPVEKLRDKKWLAKNGISPSIMDYARFDYVAQPGDSIDDFKLLSSRIGEYDEWAIQWGYQIADNTPQATNDLRHYYGAETIEHDNRIQFEDLGDDAVAAGNYGIKNLQFILPNLIGWTENNHTDIKTLYGVLLEQFGNYMRHALNYIGAGSPSTQKSALQFLNEHLFTTPDWLLDKNILSITGEQALDIITHQQSMVLYPLLSQETLSRLMNTGYSPDEFLRDLHNDIWSELRSTGEISIYRMNLQLLYLNNIQRTLVAKNVYPNQLQIPSFLINDLSILQQEIITSLKHKNGPLTKIHLVGCLSKIKSMLR